ncbi:MAG: GNAT family N-acetyltransferase, partial [Bacilli bacterium]
WNVHSSKHETRRVVQSFIDGKEVYGITIKESGKLIGSIGIHRTKPSKTVRHNAQRELGYALHPDYWNNGYMTEAVGIIVSYCFHTLKLDCIWCGHFEGNLRSKRVIEKAGFKHEFSVNKILLSLNNEERLHHYYRLMKKDYWNRSEGYEYEF